MVFPAHMAYFSAEANEVRPGLYIGGLGALRSLPFTHVLTVMADSIAEYKPQDSCTSRLVIPVYDTEDSGLLEHFPQAIAFIEQGLEAGGKVLVHCAAGVSRSATTICAYLMATEGLTPDQALASLREARRVACPNHGFLAQLALFHQMHCKLDPSNPGFKLHRVEQLGTQWRETRHLDIGSLAQLPEQPAAQDTLYRCRKCRRLVATGENVVAVPAGGGRQRPFSWGFRPQELTRNGEEAEVAGTSLFLEPMKWMAELQSGEVQGKLYCPGCKARLGSFNWAGIQASSGAWVTPAFQLHLSRLDALTPGSAPLHSLRQPRF